MLSVIAAAIATMTTFVSAPPAAHVDGVGVATVNRIAASIDIASGSAIPIVAVAGIVLRPSGCKHCYNDHNYNECNNGQLLRIMTLDRGNDGGDERRRC